MKIIEVDAGRFVNIDNVFKMDLIKVEKSDACYWRFYCSDDCYSISKEFENNATAREWLFMQIMRASGGNEVIEL
jgi:hypothetical protein